MPTKFIPGIAKETTIESHVYADGTLGSDLNDGLSLSSPKKTLQAVFALLPFRISYPTVIHLSGTFTEPGYSYAYNSIETTNFIIDGGEEVVELAGPWTSDSATASTIGLSTLTMTVDQYAGYWLEFLDGPAIGQHVLIHSHDATTFTLMKNMTHVSGNRFRIIRPKTEIYCNAANGGLRLAASGNGTVRVQRLYITGTKNYTYFNGTPIYYFVQSVVDATGGIFCYPAYQSMSSLPSYVDPYTFATVSIHPVGLSVRNAAISVYGGIVGSLYTSFLKQLDLRGCILASAYVLLYGTRVRGGRVWVLGTRDTGLYLVGSNSSGAYRDVQIDGTGATGLLVIDSRIGTNGPLIIKNCGLHGIEVDSSLVQITNTLTGSGNTGAGMFAHARANVSFSITPAVTGTVGNLSLDGTTEKVTWSVFDSGTKINSETVGNTEFNLVSHW